MKALDMNGRPIEVGDYVSSTVVVYEVIEVAFTGMDIYIRPLTEQISFRVSSKYVIWTDPTDVIIWKLQGRHQVV